MKNTEFIPADFDTHGRLRLPFLFWCVLLLQARTWVLFLMAGASRQQGDALLNLFYPDHDNFGWDCSPAFRRCWRLSLAGIVSASPALAHDALAAGAFPALAVGLATAVVDERRVAFGGDHRPAGGGSLRALVAVKQPSAESLFSRRTGLTALLPIAHSNLR